VRRLILLAFAAVLLAAAIAPAMATQQGVLIWNQWTKVSNIDASSTAYVPRDHTAWVECHNTADIKSILPNPPGSQWSIFLVGGRDDLTTGHVTGKTQCFNRQYNNNIGRWEDFGDLIIPRKDAILAVSDKYITKQDPANPTDPTKTVQDHSYLIWCFGGTDANDQPVTDVEVLDVQTKQWVQVCGPNATPQNWCQVSTVPAPPMINPVSVTTQPFAYWCIGADLTGGDASNYIVNNLVTGNGLIGDIKINVGQIFIACTNPAVMYSYDVYTNTFTAIPTTNVQGTVAQGAPAPPAQPTNPRGVPWWFAQRPAPPAQRTGAFGPTWMSQNNTNQSWSFFAIGGRDESGIINPWAYYLNQGDMVDNNVTRPWQKAGLNVGMPEGRMWGSAVQFQNGDPSNNSSSNYILVIGGEKADGSYAQKLMAYMPGGFDIWDMGSNVGPDFPVPISGHPSAVNSGSKIWVIGGSTKDPVTGQLSFVTDIYNNDVGSGKPGNWLKLQSPDVPDVLDWEPIAPIPTARERSCSAVVNGKMYVIGGSPLYIDANNNWSVPTAGLKTNEMYDPASDRWTTMAPAPYAVSHACAAAVGTKIYVIGGDHNGEYDPSDPNKIKAPYPFPDPNTGAPTDPINIVMVYDTATNSWIDSVHNPDLIAPMPVIPGVSAMSGVVNGGACVTSDGAIHVIGGKWSWYNSGWRWNSNTSNNTNNGGTPGPAQTHYRYDPSTNTWTWNDNAMGIVSGSSYPTLGPGPVLCPSIQYTGRHSLSVQTVPFTDANGSHEWIYWYGGAIDPDGETNMVARWDAMPGNTFTNQWLTYNGLQNNFGNYIWSPVNYYSSQGWQTFNGLPGGRGSQASCVITCYDGKKRPMVLGGSLGGINWNKGGGNAGVYVYFDREDPAYGGRFADSWRYENWLPLPIQGGAQAAQIGNYVYLMTGDYPANPLTPNNNYPTNKCWRAAVGTGIPVVNAKSVSDIISQPVGQKFTTATPVVVTRTWTNSKNDTYIWIEDTGRNAAVKVGPVQSYGTFSTGDWVMISGKKICDTTTLERYISPTGISIDHHDAAGVPAAIGIGNKPFIGGTTNSARQIGRNGGIGLNNMGMLVRLYGKATLGTQTPTTGPTFFYLDDGSGLMDGATDFTGGITAPSGIRVYYAGHDTDSVWLNGGEYVGVTGIVTKDVTADGKVIPVLLSDGMTTDQTDGYVRVYPTE